MMTGKKEASIFDGKDHVEGGTSMKDQQGRSDIKEVSQSK